MSEAKEAILRLMNEYCYRIDAGDMEGFAGLFEHGTFVLQGVPPDFPLQPIFIGHYYDSFEKATSGWRFVRREISPDLIGDLSFHRSDMA